jgi:hypothetical protein
MSRAPQLDRRTAAARAQALYETMRARLARLERAVAQGGGSVLLSCAPGAPREEEDPMICRWCREPVETVEVTDYPGVFIVQDCLRPACVQARREELQRQAYARQRPLSAQRPHGAVVACLPGMHESYGYTPPGQPPVCRHCGAGLAQEERG